jgi:hypothetical protein
MESYSAPRVSITEEFAIDTMQRFYALKFHLDPNKTFSLKKSSHKAINITPKSKNYSKDFNFLNRWGNSYTFDNFDLYMFASLVEYEGCWGIPSVNVSYYRNWLSKVSNIEQYGSEEIVRMYHIAKSQDKDYKDISEFLMEELYISFTPNHSIIFNMFITGAISFEAFHYIEAIAKKIRKDDLLLPYRSNPLFRGVIRKYDNYKYLLDKYLNTGKVI